jgi:hypothetical protein
MWKDPIVAETRSLREQYANQFGHNADAYLRTSFRDKLYPAKSWFHSSIVCLFCLKQVPKKKDQLQIFKFNSHLYSRVMSPYLHSK